ncbi:MAG: hypothetical protein MUD05_11675 [Candidatus Nanopelagicales bacterium]|jgi:hypothetical protein|nr:hypothetical protein [Candidatus Nanopelagicales bacterium]
MKVKLSDVGSLGWIDDIPPHDLSENPLAWSAARNVIFRSGLLERASGYAAGFDLTPTAAAYGLFSATKPDGTQFLIAGGATKVFSYTGTTENEITPATTMAAGVDARWSGGVLSGIVVLNCPDKHPQFITVANLDSGSTNFADLTNWPSSPTTTCRVMRPFKYFLFAGDMTEDSVRKPFKIRWSASAEPGALPASWVATTSNNAGSIDVSDSDGKVIDFLPLGDQLACYTENSIYLARFIGGTDAANRLVFSFQRVPVGQSGGMLGLNCGCDVPNLGHVVLGSNDVYLFNGTSTQSIIDKRLRRWLFDNIAPATRTRSFVVNHASDSEVWICFPFGSSATDCTKALVWQYGDGFPGTWGVRDLPSVTAGIHAAVAELSGPVYTGLTGVYDDLTGTYESNWPTAPVGRKTVLSATANLLYVVGNASNANGATFTAEVQRDYLAFGDAQRVKFFREIWPRFDGDGGQQIEISVGTAMSVNEPPSFQTAQTYTIGTSRAIYVNKAGRFLSLRMRSTSGTPWKLRSLDIDLQPQGVY